MHHALQIPEILLNIFGYVIHPPSCCGPLESPRINPNPDMVALARTCRTFKEPALDILWSVLGNLSPLAECIPDACSEVKDPRALSQEEWDILRSYTRRIQAIIDFDAGFFWNSTLRQTVRKGITQNPLFPNLRVLSCQLLYGTVSSPPHQYIPALTSITVNIKGGWLFARDCLMPFLELYPNLKKIALCTIDEHGYFSGSSPGVFTWAWKDLQALKCPEVKLDMNDLQQLSHLPALNELTFLPSHSLLNLNPLLSPAPLVFPSLQRLGLSHKLENMHSLLGLLSQMELPAITHLDVTVSCIPPKGIHSFLEIFQNACVNCSIEHLSLYHETDIFRLPSWSSDPVLTFNNLRLIMAFGNIRHLDLQVAGHVALTDGGLLELASAWPLLEVLVINDESGWNKPEETFGGITPDGLVQLVLTCPLLNYIALVIDTRGYTTAGEALGRLPTVNSRSNPSAIFCIDVLDSIVEDESISAMATWLAGFVRQYPRFNFRAWHVCSCLLYSTSAQAEYENRWERVYCSANDILGRSKDEHSSWREGWPGSARNI